MVSDIHIESTEHAHNVHQLAYSVSIQSASEHAHTAFDGHAHSSVCSYDHGGHMGKTLATALFINENIASQRLIKSASHPYIWFSRNTAPKLRPPIA